MYEWNLMFINVLLIQSEGRSFEEYQFSDILIMLHLGATWTLF